MNALAVDELRLHDPPADDGEAAIEANDELVVAESVISVDTDELALIDRLRPLLLERSLTELPAPIAIPDRATRAMSRRSFELEELVKLGHTDVAIAAALLRHANAAAYAGMRGVETIEDATTRLGPAVSAGLVTDIAARSLFDVSTRAEYEVFAASFRDLSRQSMTAALVATRLSDRLGLGRSALAFSAGLFHDIGKVVALRALAQLVLHGQAPRTLSRNAVLRLLEDVHVVVGAAIMESWRLSPRLVALCALHHEPYVEPVGDRVLVHLVRVVSGMDALRTDRARNGTVVVEVQQSADALGLDPTDLARVCADLRKTSCLLASMF